MGTHSGSDNERVRGQVLESAVRSVPEILAIAANFTLASGLPFAVALDPANTSRNVTLYTPAVPALMYEHELYNISTGTGNLVVKEPTGATTIGTVGPGERAILRWVNSTLGWFVYTGRSDSAAQSNAAKSTVSLYSTLASLANTNVLAWKAPFAGTLNLIGFRTKAPATTGAKAATIQARIAGVATTGGALALTSANMTPTNTRVDSSAITALNTFTAGQTIEGLVSGVTAFVEGDGYLEFDVTNTDLNV